MTGRGRGGGAATADSTKPSPTRLIGGMLADQDAQEPERFGFLLLPSFSMLAFLSAVEPLRVANRVGRHQLYAWHVYSRDGEPVTASNGMAILADAPMSNVGRLPNFLVCSSFDPERYEDRDILALLRRLDRQGTRLGAIDTGAHVLARAGLLDGYRATLHWENTAAFAERFPEVQVSEELFEADRKRISCSGGTAAIDMMLHLIAGEHGQDLAVSVSEMLLHARMRSPDDHFRMTLGQRLGVRHPRLQRIVEAMSASIEDPLDLGQLAEIGGLSRRQLERLFRANLGDTPTGYYLKLRLRRARHLLEQTDMSILEVSLACGFVSAPYFSRAYRRYFGLAPRDDRRNLRSRDGRTGLYIGGGVLRA